ncbi:MAG: erythronate-4-phosphate dehydrogenase [Pseudohongiellaceae bacterium]|jgi:erythronate-4-phosphate dehydrogenase
MKIVADENIPLLSCFFDKIGQIKQLAGRDITADDLLDADILIVRSVTQVNQSLLENSAVKFVGSCTIGMDHIDTDYLNKQGIRYENAPGCNANSVVEYILSCLSILTETHRLDWSEMSVGIVGYGNVGSLLAKRLEKLGISYKAYDPLLDETIQQSASLTSFDEVLACDIVSLHVPLTTDGDYPTYHMVNERMLSQMRHDQVLINTCRGAVVNNAQLSAHLRDNDRFTAILDVWDNEPFINTDLAKQVLIATPHIAGYSFDGKVAGTEMIYRALCQFLGLPCRFTSGQFLEEPALSKMAFTSTADIDWCLHTAIRACFDVRHDHSLLLSTLSLTESERGVAFDAFRKSYRCRREFSGVKIQLKQVDSELHRKFRALGFNVKT